MRKTVFAIIFVALFLVACSTAKTVVPQAVPIQDGYPTPSSPGEVAPVAPTNDAVIAPESGTDKVLGTVDKETSLKIDDVKCDKTLRKITFRFQNIDDQKHSWNLNQELGWGAPKDQVNVKVFVNGYEANSPKGVLKDGEILFGPAKKFSDNCGGKVVLAYGEDVTCTLTPVALKSATELTAGNNEIMISALPSSKHIIQFLCN